MKIEYLTFSSSVEMNPIAWTKSVGDGSAMIIEAESLSNILDHHGNTRVFRYEGKCHKCDRQSQVEITKTSGGYGLQGGVLYESPTRNILILCSECIKKNGNQIYDPHHPDLQEAELPAHDVGSIGPRQGISG